MAKKIADLQLMVPAVSPGGIRIPQIDPWNQAIRVLKERFVEQLRLDKRGKLVFTLVMTVSSEDSDENT